MIKSKSLIGIFLLMTIHGLNGQVYSDYFGLGHQNGVKVTSSSSQVESIDSFTLSGSEYKYNFAGTSRFLSQATLGHNYSEIIACSQKGLHGWLEEQFNIQPKPYVEAYQEIYNTASSDIKKIHPDESIRRKAEFVIYAFYEKAVKEKDVLRQKMAFALSQIFVISGSNSALRFRAKGIADYYDILYLNAFGNYRDILKKVSLHPTMGAYLSHFNNKKADPTKNTSPDENYAREIMQLFSIGLVELNLDGSIKLDKNGQPIPTYNIGDIQEMAKVFTGLSGAEYDLELNPNRAGQPLRFGRNLSNYVATGAMKMYPDHHDSGQKNLLNNTIIPAGQNPEKDIDDAIEMLFNHPNVGPFISRRLIQHFVTSNPSPLYIKRVARTFNNNGKGERGDLKAVIYAILTDPEARDCEQIDKPHTGRLKQPVERYLQLLKAFHVNSPSGKIWFNDSREIGEKLQQSILNSRTVFNFFSPFHAESKFVKPLGLVSPEFQILNSVSAIQYINIFERAIKIRPFSNVTAVNPNAPILAINNANDEAFLDFSGEIKIYEEKGIEGLLDHLSVLLCAGNLSDGTREIIVSAITESEEKIRTYPSETAVKDAIYFIMVSADYTVLK